MVIVSLNVVVLAAPAAPPPPTFRCSLINFAVEFKEGRFRPGNGVIDVINMHIKLMLA